MRFGPFPKQQVFFLLLFSGCFFNLSPAAEALQLQPAFKYDVRVVVDISGSMKKSDPDNLRVPAVKLLAEVLPAQTQAGVWTFGKFVNMLVPLGEVNASWRANTRLQADKINSIAQFTNIGEALEKASYGWRQPNPEVQRSLILLTDGLVDVDKDPQKNAAARADILNRILPEISLGGARIHTIALSEQVDKTLLKTLAVSTDGSFETALNSDELLKVFLKAFDKSVKQQQVPLTGNQFKMDAGIQEFTALVFRTSASPPTWLKSPSGLVLSQSGPRVSWFSDKRFDLITVKQPEAGGWVLEADLDPANRVTIVSDLELVVKGFPNNVFVGETIQLNIFLTEKNKTITKPEFLELLDITFKQEYQDANKIWEGKLTSYSENKIKTPEDGRYGARLNRTLLPGKHVFSVLVDGKTFERSYNHNMTVLERETPVSEPREQKEQQQTVEEAPQTEPKPQSDEPQAVEEDTMEEEEIEEEPEEAQETQEDTDDKKNNLMLVISMGFVLTNLFLVGAGIFIYKRVLKRRLQEEVSEDGQVESVEEVAQPQEEKNKSLEDSDGFSEEIGADELDLDQSQDVDKRVAKED